MNVFWQELRFYRRSVIIWILALCAGLLLFLSVYQSLASQIDTFREIVSRYPKALLAAINFRFEMFYSIYGFFSYILTFIWIAAAIQAMNYSVSAVAKENSGKTADFLLAKPVSRTHILAEKLLAVVVLLIITNLCLILTAVGGALIFAGGGVVWRSYLLLTMSVFLIQLFFVALGYILATLLPKIKTVVAISLPCVFGLFIIASFGGILDKPVFYYLTPFKYFDASYIYQHNTYQLKYLAVLAVFVLVCLTISFVVYRRKDIASQ